MLAKIALTLVVLFAIWVLFFRRPKPRPRRSLEALALVRCTDCNTWHLPGSACACKRTPGNGDGGKR
ncbi:MAG: hypothetical protein AAGI34_01990 [Pseudomonadota bacterium]